jgi:hypothetical protein
MLSQTQARVLRKYLHAHFRSGAADRRTAL